MQVYFQLDNEFADWYNGLPPHGKSKALNAVIRQVLKGQAPHQAATKTDIERLELLIKKMSIVQTIEAQEEPANLIIELPPMTTEEF